MVFEERNKMIAQMLEDAINENRSESELNQLKNDFVESGRKALNENDFAFFEYRPVMRHRTPGHIAENAVYKKSVSLYLAMYTDTGCQKVEVWRKKHHFNPQLLKPLSKQVAVKYTEEFRKKVVVDLLSKKAERWKRQNCDRLYIHEDCLSELAAKYGYEYSLTINDINIDPTLWDAMIDLNAFLDLRRMEVRSNVPANLDSSEERALKEKALNIVKYLVEKEIEYLLASE